MKALYDSPTQIRERGRTLVKRFIQLCPGDVPTAEAIMLFARAMQAIVLTDPGSRLTTDLPRAMEDAASIIQQKIFGD